jgi:VIT1/CCC1 family predicted Fe2+/Mn2+ transporter
VLGTTILGSVLSSKVGSTLVDKLTEAGTPAPIAERLSPAKELVAKGIAPSIPGAPPQLSVAIATGSHEAFMAGLQISMVVGASAAAVGAVLALLVRRQPMAAWPAEETVEN